MLIFIIFLSGIILLESREVYQGMLSQPLITSLILLLFNYDPVFVLLTATMTELFYINRVPSGAVLYPEYSFAFFPIVGFFGLIFNLDESTYQAVLFSFLLILPVSILASRIIYLKRKIMRKIISKRFEVDKIYNFKHLILISALLTLFLGTLFSFFLFLFLKSIWFFWGNSFFILNEIWCKNIIFILLIFLLFRLIPEKKEFIYLILGMLAAGIYIII